VKGLTTQSEKYVQNLELRAKLVEVVTAAISAYKGIEAQVIDILKPLILELTVGALLVIRICL